MIVGRGEGFRDFFSFFGLGGWLVGWLVVWLWAWGCVGSSFGDTGGVLGFIYMHRVSSILYIHGSGVWSVVGLI
jgi:hypothetical protein